jgi:DtxR family transcriptional regulator, Mn-dependent transcriptional regulator
MTPGLTRRDACCAAAASAAMGKYLRVIYLLSFRGPCVTTSEVAARLGVAAPSVSAMLRRLDSAGLITAAGPAGIVLSEHAERHARDVVRRHRLIETFLVQSAGMSWDEVHEEAEALQDVASDRLIDRIDTALGHPHRDPHGDPIPQPADGPADGYAEEWSPSLEGVPAGQSFRVDRISDEDSTALQYLAGLGVRPGVVLQVLDREPFGGPVWVEVGGQRRALGAPLTQLVHGVVSA